MQINGQTYKHSELGCRSLAELLKHFQLQPQSIAIEYNGEILDRKQWADVELSDLDRIELIRFVGGG